ncbi:MAG: GNAT family N-acetyltransferase [Propionibacteriaceae bacterium]|nr:GNAT family N-acetyltransferase [Propionibacteriaceae bacterium]
MSLPEPPLVEPVGTALRIIDVTADRYPECLAVLRTGFGTEVSEFGITRENTPSNPAFWDPSAIPAVVAKGFGLFAVEGGGRILGCAFAGPSRSRPRIWSLRHLAVDPATRHSGHGAALVAEGVRRARAAGAEALAIGIVAENTRLAAWYRRLGFETIDKTQYPGLVFTVERMRLALSPG